MYTSTLTYIFSQIVNWRIIYVINTLSPFQRHTVWDMTTSMEAGMHSLAMPTTASSLCETTMGPTVQESSQQSETMACVVLEEHTMQHLQVLNY